MRLALTRPASASRLAEHAVGPPGAALPARCAAQSCEKQGALLSWSIVQRGCESSTAPVLWCESLMGGNLLLHRHAQSLLYRRADLRAGGAHAHPGRSSAVAQSRALLTQEAVGELLPLDRRSSRRCRSLVLPEVLEPARAAGLAAARTPLWRRAHAAAAEAILLLTVSTPYASSEALPTSPDVARTPPGMAGPVVAWSLDDAATACKHEPRIVREPEGGCRGCSATPPLPFSPPSPLPSVTTVPPYRRSYSAVCPVVRCPACHLLPPRRLTTDPYRAAPPLHTHLTSCSTEFALRSDPSRRVPRSGLAGPEEPVRECSAATSLSQNVGSRGGVLV